MNLNNREGTEKQIKLVPTIVKDWIKVHTEFWVSINIHWPRLTKDQFNLMRKLNWRVVPSSEVGLEWRDSKNTKINVSDRWQGEMYIWISDNPNNHTPDLTLKTNLKFNKILS